MDNKTPQIRHKGFNDPWEQNQAKDVCSITTGKSNTQDQVEDGKYIFFIRSDIPVRSNRYLYDEEAVITIGDGNIGKVFHYVNGKFDLHQRCYKMSDFKEITAKYFYHYFSTKFYDRAMSMSAKATVDSVRLEMISDMVIKYPKTKREQEEISIFLDNIDNLISFHQRKHSVLTSLRQSLLSKLFPTDNEKTPKIRFKSFDIEWEKCKMDEIMKDFIVPMRDKPKIFDGNIPWTRIEDIEGRYLNGSLSGQYVSEKTISDMNLKIIPKGSLIVSASATFGVVAIVTTDLITNQTFIGLTPNSSFDIDFLYMLFQTETARKYMKEKSSGSTIFYITQNDFKNMISTIPSLPEQKKIGEAFKDLDKLINLHQQKVELLKKLKASLLGKMFI